MSCNYLRNLIVLNLSIEGILHTHVFFRSAGFLAKSCKLGAWMPKKNNLMWGQHPDRKWNDFTSCASTTAHPAERYTKNVFCTRMGPLSYTFLFFWHGSMANVLISSILLLIFHCNISFIQIC